MKPCSIWIGFDPREAAAFAVARTSIRRNLTRPIPTYGLDLAMLRDRGLYWRPTERKENGDLWDVISGAPMSTEFAISRFLVPHLAGKGWALFLDSDMLIRGRMCDLFDEADDRYAVMCVQHVHQPATGVKKAGLTQNPYPRKNWSSFLLFNCDHPSNRRLTVQWVNTLPGRELHRFCWLNESEIGALDPTWNYLVGHTDPERVPDPRVVHFTDGWPGLPGYETQPYADEWRAELSRWAA